MNAEQIQALQRRFAATTIDGYSVYPVSYSDYDNLAQAALTAMAERDKFAGTVVSIAAERDALQARHVADGQELDRMTAEMEERHERFVALQARVKALEAGPTRHQIKLWAKKINALGECKDIAADLYRTANRMEAAALLSKGSPDA